MGRTKKSQKLKSSGPKKRTSRPVHEREPNSIPKISKKTIKKTNIKITLADTTAQEGDHRKISSSNSSIKEILITNEITVYETQESS